MKAFFGSLKSTKSGKVRLPRYLEKSGYYPLIDRRVYKPEEAYYVMPRGNFIKKVSKYFKSDSKALRKLEIHKLDEMTSLYLKIQTPLCIQTKVIKEITIKSKYDGKYIEVVHVYEDHEEIAFDHEKTETMSIDFGYNNLAYCALSNENHLHIDGLKLKSMNQRYHKRIAFLASERPDPFRLPDSEIKFNTWDRKMVLTR